MIKVLIYLFPILINFLSGSMFYVTANRFTEAGAEKVYVSSTSAAWALTYFIGSLLVGRLVTERRAVPMIIAAAFLLSAFSGAFIVFPNVYLQFLWIALVGAAMAIYCTPFQVFMKRIGGGASGVVYSTAMYTWSWSFGNALGPFVFGFLPSWQSAFAINAAIAFGLALLVIWTNAYLKRHQPTGASDTQPTGADDGGRDLYAGRPDLAWLGWLGLAFGFTTLCLIRTLQQDLIITELPGIDPMHPAIMLALLSGVQGFFALSLMRTKTWMYSPWPNLAAGVVGVVSLLMIARGHSAVTFYIASTIHGFYTGYYYFMLVFHSLVHPTRSGTYVGINEAVVGVVCIVASAGGGVVADAIGNRSTFALCALLVAVVTAVQTVVLAVTSRRFARTSMR